MKSHLKTMHRSVHSVHARHALHSQQTMTLDGGNDQNQGHTMNVTAVSFHSEGKWIMTASEDGTIRIWDMRSVKHQHAL
jgi:WD40 repeat protein